MRKKYIVLALLAAITTSAYKAGKPGDSNSPPVANAGPDQTVEELSTVTMNGSSSQGKIVNYTWKQVSGPSVSLTYPTKQTARFTTPDVNSDSSVGFTLTVRSNKKVEDVDDIVINILDINAPPPPPPPPPPNQPPVADAGIDKVRNENVLIALDGSSSYDPDGSIVSYNWTQTAGPTVVINTPDQAVASFTTPEVSSDTQMYFQLTVVDNGGATDSDIMGRLIQDVTEPPPPPPPEPPSSDVIVYEDNFNFYNTEHWRQSGNAPYVENGFMVSELDRTMNTPYRTEWTLQGMADLGWKDTISPNFGQTVWYAVSIYIPEDYIYDNDTEILMQWHGRPDNETHNEGYRNPNVALRIDYNQWELSILGDYRLVTVRPDPGYSRQSQVDMGDVAVGAWTHWTFKIKWGYDSDGDLDMYKNGELIYSETNRTNSFNDLKGAPYLKMGLYKWNWKDGRPETDVSYRKYYHDNLIIGNENATLQDMTRPEPPKPEEPLAYVRQNLIFEETFSDSVFPSNFNVSGNPPTLDTTNGWMAASLNRYEDVVPYRTEFNTKGLNTQYFDADEWGHVGYARLGETYWYSLDIFIPSDFVYDSSRESIWQWHGKPDVGEDWRSSTIALGIQGDKYWMSILADSKKITPDSGSQTYDSERYTRYFFKGDVALVEPTVGKWTNWVLRVKWAYDNTGSATLYQNDTEVHSEVNMPNAFNDDLGPTMKFGVYKWPWKVGLPATETDSRLYFYDNLRIGNSNATLKDMSRTTP